MNFQSTYETIKSSRVFKNFIKENPQAELIAGFFILDLLAGKNEKSIDYKFDNKIMTFSLNENDEIIIKEDELIEDSSKPPLTEISPDIKVDLDELPSIAQQEAEKNNVKNKFQKIIAILQNHENQEIWNLTCMLDGLIILNILINSDTGDIIKFERKSITDFIKKK